MPFVAGSCSSIWVPCRRHVDVEGRSLRRENEKICTDARRRGALVPDPISYRSARHLMVDKDRLPVSFARWLEAALHYVQRLQAQGYVVEKVMIVPSQFREWAMRTGHDHDADGRARFAAAMLDRLRLARAL
jgi:hypothetical protein